MDFLGLQNDFHLTVSLLETELGGESYGTTKFDAQTLCCEQLWASDLLTHESRFVSD